MNANNDVLPLTTESDSHYDSLEFKSTTELLTSINMEDGKVASAVKNAVENGSLSALVEAIYARMLNKGRLFYIGAGTSGRLGIVDASECPPTFGIDHGIVVGVIAGGDGAIRKAVEFAEDDFNQAWLDMKNGFDINENDCVVGIAASGRTPYVIGGLRAARAHGCITGSIVCNMGSEVSRCAEFPVEVIVGPEFITGSTRMKAGTAQKMVLNMLSTTLMIKLGRVRGNKMVDMALSNEKLVSRGLSMMRKELYLLLELHPESLSPIPVLDDMQLNQQEEFLCEQGSVRNAVDKMMTLILQWQQKL